MPITHPPLSAEDLRTLATHTVSHLPVSHGPWRMTDAPDRPDVAAVVVEDESRRVLLTADGQGLAVRAWPVNGTTAPAATAIGRRDATGRTVALAIARNHLGPQHPAPLNEAQRERQELRAVDAVTARIPAGAAEVAVSRTDRWFTVDWKHRGRGFSVRVDGPQRVQTEVGGLSLDALSAALDTALRTSRGHPVTDEQTPGGAPQAPRPRFHRCDDSCRPVPGTPSEDGDATGGGPYLPGSAIEGAW